MKRLLFLMIALFFARNVLSQKTDSVCRVPIMIIEDSSLFDIFDTLFVLEKKCDTKESHKNKISIIFLDTSGLYCMIHQVKDSSYGSKVLSSMVNSVSITYYNDIGIYISGYQPSSQIMSNSGEYTILECVSYSTQDILYEDYDDESEPDITIFAKRRNGRMRIYMIVNNYGDILYDASQ